jgi:4-aminobutyrate aminotransferase-like enzyme
LPALSAAESLKPKSFRQGNAGHVAGESILDADKSGMIGRRQRLLGSAYRLFYEQPVHLVRGEGVWLYDADGRQYLDMYNNVPHVGHCHPQVVEAISRQLATLNTHTRYLHDNVIDLAERVTGKCPDELDNIMFSCTGSEANELALRIARTVTGGTGIVVTDSAYHGNTQAIYEISTEDIPAAEVPEYVVTVPSPDTYRDEPGRDEYADHVTSAIETLRERGFRPAAFIIDTIISSGGVVAPPPGYLKNAAAAIRAAGGLFIADEVQPGFGRTGKNFWGFEADGVVPDIVTLGKPMGNGHPIAATIVRSELIDQFSSHSHYFNTFGGNPVSCAAGLAVLDVLEDEGLQENALETGNYISAGLLDLAARHSCIGDVRGSGFFKAVELVTDRDSKAPATTLAGQVVNGLRDRGVLTGSIGPHDNILKLRPAMVFSRDNADLFLQQLDECLSEHAR